MLQTIREHTQGWIAGTIVSIIILTFALWGIHSYFVGGNANTDVAQVNGTSITKEQLNVTLERLRRQNQSQFGSANNPFQNKDEATLKKRALQALVEIEVLKQAASDQGFRVSDRQIDNSLQGMPDFQVDGQFSLERFQRVLSSNMLSTGDFLELIKTSLLIDQPKFGILFSSFALPQEANSSIALVNQERNVDYLTIPFQYFLTQTTAIAPEKIQAYYENHENDFMTPEQVSVEYVALTLKDISTQIQPTDAMLTGFYQDNLNSYTQPMQWKLVDMEIPIAAKALPEDIKKAQEKANDALSAIKKGEDFAKVSHGYSGTLSSKGWIALNQVPNELQKPVSALTSVGDVSEPIRTSTGFEIIKVVDIQKPAVQAFTTVKDKIKDTYVRQRAEEKMTQLRDRLADLTYEHPESLLTAAKEMNLPIKTSELFSKNKGTGEISQNKKVRDIAFSTDVLNAQNNSDVIQVNPETLIVIHLKTHVPSALQPLSAVAKQIEDKLKTEQVEVQAQNLADDLKKKLQSGQNAQQLAALYKFNWNKAGYIGRYSTKIDSAILDLAFRLPRPIDQPNKPIYGVARLPNGYAIVALNAVKPGTSNDPKQNSVFAEQYQNSEGLLEYDLYKRSLINRSQISTNSP